MLRKDAQEAVWPSFPHENTSTCSLCYRKPSADRIWWCRHLELPSFHKKCWRRTELLLCIKHRSKLFYNKDMSRLSHMASLSSQLCDYYCLCYWRLKHSLWCSQSWRSPLKLRAIHYLLPILYKMNFGDYFPKHKIKELAFMISCPMMSSSSYPWEAEAHWRGTWYSQGEGTQSCRSRHSFPYSSKPVHFTVLPRVIWGWFSIVPS